MRLIELTQGQSTQVDDDLYEWLSAWKWCAKWYPKYNAYYAVRSSPWLTNGKRIHMPMHRQILGMDPRDPREGDHWDGKTLNNQRHNLREATSTQNQANRKYYKNSTGYKGVRASGKRFMAAIDSIHLGTFDTAKEAHQAYCAAAEKKYKKFARFA